MPYIRWIIVTGVMLISVRSAEKTENKSECPILATSQKLNISQVMGVWYAVRGIEHNNLRQKAKGKSSTNCPTLTLAQMDQNEISFRWSENSNTTRYDIKFLPDANNPNLWLYIQKLKSKELPFRTLQVTEIDSKNIVITICAAGNRLASAVLCREPKFDEEKVTTASQKLAEQGLSIVQSFNRCQTN